MTPSRLTLALCCAAALAGPASAQDPADLLGRHGKQLDTKQQADVAKQAKAGKLQLPGEAAKTDSSAHLATEGNQVEIAKDFTGQLSQLAELGLLRKNQVKALTRAFNARPDRIAGAVSEINRFVHGVQTRAQLADLVRCLGSKKLAERTQRLLVLGAKQVLRKLSKGQSVEAAPRASIRWAGDLGLFRFSDPGLPVFSEGEDNNHLLVPLGPMTLELSGRGGYRVLDRDGKPRVMTYTDPLYLSMRDIKTSTAARSWSKALCAYHFPKAGWSIIGEATSSSGQVKTLWVTNGERMLQIDGVIGDVSQITARKVPLVRERLRQIMNDKEVQHLVFDNDTKHLTEAPFPYSLKRKWNLAKAPRLDISTIANITQREVLLDSLPRRARFFASRLDWMSRQPRAAATKK